MELLVSTIDSAHDWFWTVELANTDEFVQSAGDLFEYWKDGEQILDEEMPPEESIKKLFEEFLS